MIESIAEQNEEFNEAREELTENEGYSDDDGESSPHAQRQQDSAVFIPR